jgi:hypothetical protein
MTEPGRDDFPNNFVGDLVHTDRGWAKCGHGVGMSLDPRSARGSLNSASVTGK